jgi:hypothetical protein
VHPCQVTCLKAVLSEHQLLLALILCQLDVWQEWLRKQDASYHRLSILVLISHLEEVCLDPIMDDLYGLCVATRAICEQGCSTGNYQLCLKSFPECLLENIREPISLIRLMLPVLPEAGQHVVLIISFKFMEYLIVTAQLSVVVETTAGKCLSPIRIVIPLPS